MLEERTLHLINADIDGELTPDEREDLDVILESSSDARAMKAELLRLSNLLDNQPEQLPPSDLSKQILNKLAPPPRASNFSLSSLFASFQPATAGLAFAAGLLMTVGFYELSPNGQSLSETASMVGTMVASQSGSQDLLKNDVLLKGDGFSGTVSLRSNDGVYILNFDLDSRDLTEIEVGLDRTGLSFGGFAETHSDADKVFETVTMSGGTLHVVNQGRQQFAVFLRVNSPEQAIDAGSITIDFSSDGDRLYEGVPES
jgi:hypothetical protein